MKSLRWVCFAVLGLLWSGGSLTLAGETPTSGSLQLQYRTFRKWNFDLPAEKFVPVSAELRVADSTFGVTAEGTALWIDRDGDGESDVKAEGTEASVTLITRKDGGRDSRYSLRLENRSGWQYSCGGAVIGKLGDTKITIFDQNLNGVYGDIGEDAMVLGRSKIAGYLSKVICVDGSLYEIEVAADGSHLDYKPFEGETGEFKLGYQTRAKLISVLLRSADGRYCFDLAEMTQANSEHVVQLPAGEYTVERGQLGLGGSRVWFRTGRSQPLAITAGERFETHWGGPVKAEFAYQRTTDEIRLSPDAVWYFGSGGEEYHGWNPVGKSPKFTVRAKKSGREIAEAFFPGTC